MSERATAIAALNERSRDIFRTIVDSFVETGEPVGSRTLSKRFGLSLSPASIRNVMADLEDQGLIYAPHTSAGRMPTEAGLRLYVSGLLEVGRLAPEERLAIEARCAAQGRSVEQTLDEAITALSGLSRCASLVVAPKSDIGFRHLEFVPVGAGRALVVMVTEQGLVENRIIEVPAHLPPSALTEAGNYLSARLAGRTFEEAGRDIHAELAQHKAQLDELTTKVVEAGLAVWSGEPKGASLIVRGQARLLENVGALADLEHIRTLFEALETKEQMLKLLEVANQASGVQIYIGAQNELFGLAGCSMIVAPYQNSREQIVGAIGVIGPTRLNYARIIPLVDYTAKVIGRLIG
ncbi:MAG: heat-inducible transcriptional repressor HrcA [Alphaproteobacteria bacterium]|nr:heat-inducible transcriptional repressor HrcA [Alphaproteobacteria bacterium]